jgi:Spy/CpxP family protein refolding chaperone
MNRISYLSFALFLVLLIGCSHNQQQNQQHSPYAGEEAREIKAFTNQEIEGYLNGMGMGLSKVAELNQYPGPKHVLELADQLELSNQQKEQTKTLFNEMKKKAINIGETYITKERELNQMFESGNVSSSTVDSLLVEIGKIKGSLRATHVNTHIQMKEILTTEQIKKYDELRGYGSGNSTHHHQKHS